MGSRLVAVAMIALAASACSTETTGQPAPIPAETTATTTVPVVSSEQTQNPPESTTTEPASDCVRLADFSVAEANQRWQVVNDNVMGGQSLGGATFTDTSMVFSGEINTDGGGFSSLRLPLEPNALADANEITFRAKADERSYDVTFRDELEGRNARVTHRTTLPFTSPGQWETVTVSLDDLYATIFGEPVVAEPFRKDLASRLGLMISDGVDGSFGLEIEWIHACQ